MSEESKPTSLVLLNEQCHGCKILERAVEILTSEKGPTIPIILACAGYEQKTTISGTFPGRKFTYMKKPAEYIKTYIVPGAKLRGDSWKMELYGEKILCPLDLP